MKKEPKSYHKLYKENKGLKANQRHVSIVYIVMLLILFFCFMVETATVGDYILSKLDVERKIVYPSATAVSDRSDYFVVWSSGSWSPAPIETLASGACVDRAQTIINMLKRRYVSFDRIRAAISDDHVQAVQLNIDGTIDFLKLEGRNVVIGKPEFSSGFDKLIDPDDFLKAIEYFKPDIDVSELQAYLDSKYKERPKQK